MNRGPEGGIGWFRRGKEAAGEVRANPDNYMKPYAEDEDTSPNPQDWEAPDSIDDHSELVDDTLVGKVAHGKDASVNYRRNDEPRAHDLGLTEPDKGIRNRSQDRRAGFEKPDGFVQEPSVEQVPQETTEQRPEFQLSPEFIGKLRQALDANVGFAAFNFEEFEQAGLRMDGIYASEKRVMLEALEKGHEEVWETVRGYINEALRGLLEYYDEHEAPVRVREFIERFMNVFAITSPKATPEMIVWECKDAIGKVLGSITREEKVYRKVLEMGKKAA